MLAGVGFRGTCYQRSLPLYESDAYNFLNATLRFEHEDQRYFVHD